MGIQVAAPLAGNFQGKSDRWRAAVRRPRKRAPLDHRQLGLLPVAAYLCDSGGIVIDYNSQAANLWARSPQLGNRDERFCGFRRLFRPDGTEVPLDRSPVAQALERGEPEQDVALCAERGDCSRISVIVSAMPLAGRHHRMACVLAFIQEVGEPRQHRTQELAALTRLTTDTMHGYCSVLTAISNNLELIKRRVDNPSILRLINAARESTVRGLEITDRLSAFLHARQLVCRGVDINVLIGELQNELQGRGGKRVPIDFHPTADLWPAIADGGQLKFTFCQLVTEASLFLPAGGRLVVTTKNVRLQIRDGELAAGDYVGASIGASGHGASRAIAAKAFERYLAQKVDTKHSGQRLWEALGIASLGGGDVRIERLRGQGASLDFYLPSARHGTAANTRAAGPEMLQEGRAAVVAHTDPRMRTIAAEGLSNCGFTVFEARSGPAAVDVVRLGRDVALVVIDEGLVTGRETQNILSEMRAARRDLKVIVMAGYPFRPDLEKMCRGYGAFLRKPFTISDLIACIPDAAVNGQKVSANYV